jgi:hypothetical protein
MKINDIVSYQPFQYQPELDPMAAISVTTEMNEVLVAMRAYASTAAAYQDGIQNGFTTAVDAMCDWRNLIQWHLLSLPPASQLGPNFGQTHPLYEISRIAALIFGVGVTFPLPFQNAPMPILVRSLQSELREYARTVTLSSWAALHVLLWAITLSGIAATGTADRVWYIDKLTELANANELRTWGDLKMILKSILWLDTACDWAGEKLWDEAMKMRRT